MSSNLLKGLARIASGLILGQGIANYNSRANLGEKKTIFGKRDERVKNHIECKTWKLII